jgi:hypothetical protein
MLVFPKVDYTFVGKNDIWDSIKGEKGHLGDKLYTVDKFSK